MKAVQRTVIFLAFAKAQIEGRAVKASRFVGLVRYKSNSVGCSGTAFNDKIAVRLSYRCFASEVPVTNKQ